MAADRVQRDVLIEAPIDVVWEVITRPEHVVRWFSDEAEIDLRPGGDGLLTFHHRATSTHPLRFESVEPPRRLVYRWAYPPGGEPGPGRSVLVEFTLAEEGANTRLTVVETGIELMGWSEGEQQDYVDSHARGWTEHFERLRAYAPTVAGRTAR
jgi:uncharacterized protein YndB with AHSA1/START domain